jgi:hypothetical protein
MKWATQKKSVNLREQKPRKALPPVVLPDVVETSIERGPAGMILGERR